jgi:RNA polymerase sigma factor (sigma-70 family)
MHRETVPSRDVDDSQDEVLAREPSPGEVHAFLDQLEHFLTQLSPQEREILELRAQGCTVEDIAKRLGTYERKIYRVLERVRMLAEQQELPC